MAQVRLDKIGKDTHIVDIKFATDLKNGSIVGLGTYNADGSYTAIAVADVAVSTVVLHYSTPMVYSDEKSERDYVLPANTVGRAYILRQGDIVTITDDMITGTSAVGNLFVPVAAAAQGKVQAASTTERLVGKVIEKTVYGGEAATVIEIVKAI